MIATPYWEYIFKENVPKELTTNFSYYVIWFCQERLKTRKLYCGATSTTNFLQFFDINLVSNTNSNNMGTYILGDKTKKM